MAAQSNQMGLTYRRFRAALAVMLIMFAPKYNAYAEYIVGSYVLCRAEPAETGTVVGYLTTGDTVSIVEQQKKWTKITRAEESDEPPCWVERKEVRAATGYEQAVGHPDLPHRQMWMPTRKDIEAIKSPPAAPLTTISTARTYNSPTVYSSTPRKIRKAKSTRRSGRGSSYSPSGYCPCSSRNICIGPRGGRYCITSGGNKRYGV